MEERRKADLRSAKKVEEMSAMLNSAVRAGPAPTENLICMTEAGSRKVSARRTNIYAYLERELDGRDYFADRFSLGDISFIPPLANLERAGYSIAGGFPNLKAWWARMKARPSFGRSWPD
jgi:glutathione S-transferase